jgi:hypothetical protein
MLILGLPDKSLEDKFKANVYIFTHTSTHIYTPSPNTHTPHTRTHTPSPSAWSPSWITGCRPSQGGSCSDALSCSVWALQLTSTWSAPPTLLIAHCSIVSCAATVCCCWFSLWECISIFVLPCPLLSSRTSPLYTSHHHCPVLSLLLSSWHRLSCHSSSFFLLLNPFISFLLTPQFLPVPAPVPAGGRALRLSGLRAAHSSL